MRNHIRPAAIRRAYIYGISILLVLTVAAGCKNYKTMLEEAVAAENSGEHRQATQLFAEIALGNSPSLRLIEPQLGQIIQPDRWQREVEKFIQWLTEPATQKSNTFLRDALNGLNRAAAQFESSNIARTAAPAPFDTPAAFAEQWNRAFNPPPTGDSNRNAVIKQATDNNFSILRLTAPQSYRYDISVISRKTSRRMVFTLFAESSVLLPLPPADYIIVLRSRVDFQQGQHWVSEYSAFNLTVTDEQSLIAMDFRTSVPRRQ